MKHFRILFLMMAVLFCTVGCVQAQKKVQAPDFTLTDINGKALSLSDFKGKYVVIDFWGSWCYWCIKGLPDMKEYYKKYKGKLEIIGVDCNDSDAKWRAAVKENDIPWKHVYLPRVSNLLELYGVERFPTKVIVDPKGYIHKVVVGEKPEFYGELDMLLK